MILIKSILIYLIVINIYFYTKNKTTFLGLRSWGHFMKNLFLVLSFLILVVIFLRVMNIFRDHKILDLKYYMFTYTYDLVFVVLGFTLLYWVRKNLMFLVKLSWFKLHYFGLSDFLPMNPYAEKYRFFYFLVIKDFCDLGYNKMYWLDKLATLLLLVLVLRDILNNDWILSSSLWFIPYYSLYKLVYICVRFVATKQDIAMDYYMYHGCYVLTGFVSLDSGHYAMTWEQNFDKMNQYEIKVIKV